MWRARSSPRRRPATRQAGQLSRQLVRREEREPRKVSSGSSSPDCRHPRDVRYRTHRDQIGEPRRRRNLFWDTHLMERTAGNVYLASVPFAEKPIEEIKAVHRRRARKKRTIKKKIANAVGAAFTVSYTHLDVYKRQIQQCASVVHGAAGPKQLAVWADVDAAPVVPAEVRA